MTMHTLWGKRKGGGRCAVAVVLMPVLWGIVCAQEQVDSPLACYDGPFENALMDGCVDDCAAFETLPEAEQHCNELGDCNGIVKTTYGDEGALRLGVGLYEVRMGPGIKQQHGEKMWVKQEVCGQSVLEEGRGDHQQQPLYDQSSDLDLSEGPSSESGYGRFHSGDDWDDDWDEGLDGIAESYRAVFLQILMLVSFLGLVATLLFISYKMGHDMTIEIVDRALGFLSKMKSRARESTPDMASRSTYNTL